MYITVDPALKRWANVFRPQEGPTRKKIPRPIETGENQINVYKHIEPGKLL